MAEMISIAIARAKPDRADDLEQELRARIAPTRSQPGCLAFSLHRLRDDPTSVVAYERWASAEDWRRHLQGDHVTSLMTVFSEILVGPPEITVLDPLPGEPAPRAVVEGYVAAWQRRDFAGMRERVSDQLQFHGPLDTFTDADAHHAAIRALSENVTRVDVERIWSDDTDVLVWYTLTTTIAPPASVAEWFHTEHGKITRIRVTFDARPFQPAATP